MRNVFFNSTLKRMRKCMIDMQRLEPKNEIKMSKAVRFCFELEEGARLVYAELSSQADEGGSLIYQTKQLAALFQVSDATMRKWINQLYEHKFIDLGKTVSNGKRFDVIHLINK